jgi:hypothetical protein
MQKGTLSFTCISPPGTAINGSRNAPLLTVQVVPRPLSKLLDAICEEKVERFRKREAEALVAAIRAELEAWSQQPGLIDMVRDARPGLPEELTDRQQDIC